MGITSARSWNYTGREAIEWRKRRIQDFVFFIIFVRFFPFYGICVTTSKRNLWQRRIMKEVNGVVYFSTIFGFCKGHVFQLLEKGQNWQRWTNIFWGKEIIINSNICRLFPTIILSSSSFKRHMNSDVAFYLSTGKYQFSYLNENVRKMSPQTTLIISWPLVLPT